MDDEYYNIKVLDKEKTLKILLDTHASIIRFGDGEMDLERNDGIWEKAFGFCCVFPAAEDGTVG